MLISYSIKQLDYTKAWNKTVDVKSFVFWSIWDIFHYFLSYLSQSLFKLTDVLGELLFSLEMIHSTFLCYRI